MSTENSTTYNLLVDGQIVSAENGKYFESINPSTGEPFARVANADENDIKKTIASARLAFDSGSWSGLSVAERGKYLLKIAELIRTHAKELAQLECQDAGKTIKHATFIDVPTCADTFEYFGKINDALRARPNPVAAPVKSVTEFEPVGVVACVIPWNYPLIMFGWKVAPALITGNCVIFKPSASASVSVLRLAQIIQKVGLPKGVLNIITADNHQAAAHLFTSKDVDKVSFTGGTVTGQNIMSQAAATTKKLTLELGGKSPNIVFADCDQEAALGGTMSAIFMNQGQMCTAGSRLLLEDKIYDEFLQKLKERTEKLRIGNAANFDTDFGPIATKDQLETICTYIAKGKQEGAKLVCGGNKLKISDCPNGYYIEPTIFSDVKNSMTIAQEEIFGPVLCVIKFSSLEEAVKIANDTKFGLASCIWSKDIEKAENVARKIKAGTVWINTYGGFYNEAAFGGYKQSGFGRELGIEGLLEYTQSKHICLDQTPGGKPLAAAWF